MTPRSCPACGFADSRSLGRKQQFAIQRCLGCSTLFVDQLPAAESALDYEDYYHAGNLTVPGFVDRRLDEIVDGLREFRQRGRWLDIGCGAGALMRAAARAGWSVEGTEMASQPVAMLEREGFAMHLGDVTELSLDPGAFDVVTLVEVIEHLPDPGLILRRALELLRPGGALFLTTPNACGLSGRLLGLRWSIVSPPEHLQLFSGRGLAASLVRSGFGQSTIRSRGANPYEIVSAVRSREAAPLSGSDRVQAAYKLNAALEGRRGGGYVKAAANAGLNRFGLGDSLACRAVRPTEVPTTRPGS